LGQHCHHLDHILAHRNVRSFGSGSVDCQETSAGWVTWVSASHRCHRVGGSCHEIRTFLHCVIERSTLRGGGIRAASTRADLYFERCCREPAILVRNLCPNPLDTRSEFRGAQLDGQSVTTLIGSDLLQCAIFIDPVESICQRKVFCIVFPFLTDKVKHRVQSYTRIRRGIAIANRRCRIHWNGNLCSPRITTCQRSNRKLELVGNTR